MNCGAIICEYNPFHNGHLYHIEKTKSITGADNIIAVMSGNFTQRGEPAIVDKWTRARTALECGADIVLELPSVYVQSSAQYYAGAGVLTAKNTGIVDFISFGAETVEDGFGFEKGGKLAELAALRNTSPDDFRKDISENIKNGMGYAAAVEKTCGIKLSPNDILAVEYLSALMKYDAEKRITPVFIKRGGTVPHGSLRVSDGSITSAASIRNEIEGSTETVRKYMPEKSFDTIFAALQRQGGALRINDFSEVAVHELRRLGAENIKNLPFASDGIEYKLYESARKYGTVEEIINACVGKNVTRSRLSRIIISALIGSSSELFAEYRDRLPYIRVLGFKKSKESLLGNLCDNARCPVIIQPSKASLDGTAEKLFGIDCNATDVYMAALKNRDMRRAGQDFSSKTVIV